MEPDILVSREQPSQTRTDNTDNVAQHRDENQTAVEGEDQTCSSRDPNGPFELVQGGKLCMRLLYHRPQGLRLEGACKRGATYLGVPPIPEKEEMEAVE